MGTNPSLMTSISHSNPIVEEFDGRNWAKFERFLGWRPNEENRLQGKGTKKFPRRSIVRFVVIVVVDFVYNSMQV